MTDSSSLAEKSGIEAGHTTRRQFVTTSIAAASIATAAGVASAQDSRPKIIDAWGHVSVPDNENETRLKGTLFIEREGECLRSGGSTARSSVPGHWNY